MNKHSIMPKMLVRDIRRNFFQYLSVIAITLLAVTLFCGFISNTLSIDKRVQDYFRKSNLADLVVQFSKLDADDNTYFDGLGNSDNISLYEYRLYVEGKLGQKNAKIYSGKNAISTPLIVEGISGVLLDIRMKPSYAIGDVVELTIQGYPTLQLSVTGFMNFAEVSTLGNEPIYIDSDVLESALFAQLSIPIPVQALYNQVLIKTSSPLEIKAEIEAYYSSQDNNRLIFVYDHSTIESVAMLEGEVETSLRMIYIFPVIFLLVSILVILTTVNALILRERTNIGTLKALGIENSKILLYYACIGASLCFIGGLLGAAISPFIVPNLMTIKYNLVYSLPTFSGISFSFLWSAISIIFMCALALAIGIMSCKSLIKENPAQCMRPMPPKENFFLQNLNSYTNKETTWQNKKRNQKRNLPLKMALRNIIIKPSRAFMTIVGVMGCTALLVCSFGIGDTINNSVDLELGKQFKYDINTSYSHSVANEFLDLMSQLEEEGVINDYETYKTFYMTANNGTASKNLIVYSIAQDSSFTTIRPYDGALISRAIAQELNIKSGEQIKLFIGSNAYDLKITGIIDTAITKGIFVSHNLFDSNHHYSGMWIKANVTNELLSLINSKNGTSEAESMSQRYATAMDAVSSIDTIRHTMMIFSIVLSIVVLYNLSLLNLKERNRNIATLKVLGFSNRDIALSLIFEIMILVLGGIFLGLFLGYPILYLVLNVNKTVVITLQYFIRPISYIFSVLLSIITAIGINLLFGIRIKRIKLVDSLKSVE